MITGNELFMFDEIPMLTENGKRHRLRYLKTFVGKRFWSVYKEVANDGIGGHVIRCIECGIVLECRAPDEVIQKPTDLICLDCMRPGLAFGKIKPADDKK